MRNTVTDQTGVAPALEIVKTPADFGMLQNSAQLLVDGIDGFGMGRHSPIVLLARRTYRGRPKNRPLLLFAPQ